MFENGTSPPWSCSPVGGARTLGRGGPDAVHLWALAPQHGVLSTPSPQATWVPGAPTAGQDGHRASDNTAMTAWYFCSCTLNSLTMNDCQGGTEATVKHLPEPCKAGTRATPTRRTRARTG